jgi:hypothetical protein
LEDVQVEQKWREGREWDEGWGRRMRDQRGWVIEESSECGVRNAECGRGERDGECERWRDGDGAVLSFES